MNWRRWSYATRCRCLRADSNWSRRARWAPVVATRLARSGSFPLGALPAGIPLAGRYGVTVSVSDVGVGEGRVKEIGNSEDLGIKGVESLAERSLAL
jgi:hypothetical protein